MTLPQCLRGAGSEHKGKQVQRSALGGPRRARPAAILADDINGFETVEQYAIRQVLAAAEQGLSASDLCIAVAERALARRRVRISGRGVEGSPCAADNPIAAGPVRSSETP